MTIVRRRRSDAVRVAGGLVVVTVTGAIASSGEVGDAERRVLRAVNGLPDIHPGVLWPQQQFGNLMVGPVIVALAAAKKQWHLAGSAAMATGLKLVLERVVKAVIERERPGTTVPETIRRGRVPHQGLSFVSGHATLTTALAVVLAPHLRGGWRVVPPLAAGTVCVARVYSGAHNPLDVIGGIGLGMAAGGTSNLVLGVPTTS